MDYTGGLFWWLCLSVWHCVILNEVSLKIPIIYIQFSLSFELAVCEEDRKVKMCMWVVVGEPQLELASRWFLGAVKKNWTLLLQRKYVQVVLVFQRHLLLLVLSYRDLITVWQKSWHCLALAILCSSTWKKWLLKLRNAQFWAALVFSSLSSQYSLIFLTSLFREIWGKTRKAFRNCGIFLLILINQIQSPAVKTWCETHYAKFTPCNFQTLVATKLAEWLEPNILALQLYLLGWYLWE